MADHSTRNEPEVSVGIVLPQDGATKLHLDVPDREYTLGAGAGTTYTARATAVDLGLAAGGVRATMGGRNLGNAQTWTLVPLGAGTRAGRPDDSGDPPAVRIDGITAGRGFHWQTTTQQRLPGKLSVRRVGDTLLLATCLPLDQYLTGVITAEMSGECPVEFLKAQCVVARSWTLAHSEGKHDDLGLDLCNDDCCQRYQGVAAMTPTAGLAVRETSGLVLLAGGRVVDANYSKSCGGVVESPMHALGTDKPGIEALVDAPPSSPLHGLFPITDHNIEEYVAEPLALDCAAYCSPQCVDETTVPRYLGSVDRGGGLFRWTITHERAALAEMLRRKGCAPDDLAEVADLVVTGRGVSGRATALDIAYLTKSGGRSVTTITDQYAIRAAMHDAFLYSSAFHVVTDRDDSGRALRFHLHGAGWGHGVGLCQIGALGMALAGFNHRQILNHYFPTAELGAAYRS